MKRAMLSWIAGAAALFMFALPAMAGKTNVLILNSYENGYAWSDKIVEGIRAVFSESGVSIELQVEYMDSKRYRGEAVEETLLALYRHKLTFFRPDIVIASDNNAFRFAVTHRQALFPEVPLVFCGVNNYTPELLQGQAKITGVAESVDISGNINIALKLHPTRNRIVVITDSSATGVAVSSEIRKAYPDRDRQLRIEFINMANRDNLFQTVRQATDDTIFFFIPQYSAGDGTFYGTMGGRMASGRLHGETAAHMALEILSGTPVSELPVSFEAQYSWIFDYNQLKKFNIPMSTLPDEAEILNMPQPFYRLNRELFWVLVVSFATLTVVLVFLVINIIMRRRVEDDLKDQLSFLEIFMETVPIPIYVKDLAGHYQGVNREFEKWFGVTRSEILGHTDELFYPEKVPPLSDESDSHLTAENGIRVYHSRIFKHGSDNHHVILHKATYRNAKNEICGLVGAILDINDMKRAQSDLQKAEERYRSIFENATKGIFLADLSGRILNINNAFAQMLGYSGRKEALTHIDKIENHYATEDTRKKLREMIRIGNDIQGLEIEFFTITGEKRWASLNATLVRNKKGELEHIEGIGEDITQRKQAEIAMEESKDKLQIVLDNIPQLVYWQDPSLTYVGGNRSFKLFYGLDPAKNVDVTYTDLMAEPEDIRTSCEVDRSVIQFGTPRYRIRRNIKKLNGKEVCLEINKIPLSDEHGHVSGILGTAEDITKKVNLEKQLVQSQKMEALGTLSGGIAHDFNNILTSIINSTELALEDIDPEAMAADDLRRVLKASSRGSELVNRILAFSRPSREEHQIVNVTDVVGEALSLFRSTIPGNIELSEVKKCSECICLAAPTQLHQIIMNLCTNSFHAMKTGGGTITVSVAPAEVDEHLADLLSIQPGDYCRITVSDNGPGIPSELMDKIFAPFFTTKEKGGGTGLGLAVVHGILKGHRGGIHVSSLPGIETTFDIYLPRTEKPDVPAAKRAALPSSGKGTILFVEDDEEQQQTVPRVLERLGYQVLVAGDAAMALAMVTAQTEAIDLVITDFDMPGDNGFVLAAKLCNIAPACPVIIVSGRQKSLSMDRTDNVRSVLIKPYNRQSLSEAINTVLHQEPKEIP
ncbi:PAS domain S-box protein [Desulfoluna spongiiphila]|uniref:histidine kinase n=1 Tax=Desulfoluna spongiiphila TaxID=419481 RepID=A0A1G5GX62_9BACT|nr:PAS domain S-box protein [Desulfoluna spongiiphila]SCY55248.1 PAS domain S-box-containing protein [Desulfoluna spongiiphila]